MPPFKCTLYHNWAETTLFELPPLCVHAFSNFFGCSIHSGPKPLLSSPLHGCSPPSTQLPSPLIGHCHYPHPILQLCTFLSLLYSCPDTPADCCSLPAVWMQTATLASNVCNKIFLLQNIKEEIKEEREKWRKEKKERRLKKKGRKAGREKGSF